MAVFSVVFISAAVTLYVFGFGDSSLVYANILNLSARIIYALRFTSAYFHYHRCDDILTWKNVMPRKRLLLVSSLSSLAIFLNNSRSNVSGIVAAGGRGALLEFPVIMHIGLGGALALTCMTVWWSSSASVLAKIKRE